MVGVTGTSTEVKPDPATTSVTSVPGSTATVPTFPLDAKKSPAVTVDTSTASLKVTLKVNGLVFVTPSVSILESSAATRSIAVTNGPVVSTTMSCVSAIRSAGSVVLVITLPD